MGGRGGSSGIVNGNIFGQSMNIAGYYAPTDTTEAENWHLQNGTFSWDLWNRLTDDERKAIETYTGSMYDLINATLFGQPTTDSSLLKIISDAKAGLSKTKTTKDFVVWRGDTSDYVYQLLGGTPNQEPDRKFIARSIGKTVEFKGFMSSAITEGEAWTYKGVTVKIKVPKGTEGIYVDPVSMNNGEKEFLFNAGTRMKVRRVEMNYRGKITEIELEVVGNNGRKRK